MICEHIWIYKNKTKLLRVCSECGVIHESYFAPFNDVRYWKVKARTDNPKALINSWPDNLSFVDTTNQTKKPVDIETLGLTEEDVEEFGKVFLKNVDELAEIDEK